MDKIVSPAKVNLFLDVLYKRPDGYHEIRSVMQKIKLHDNLIFDIKKQTTDDWTHNIFLSSNLYYLPLNEKNLCYKAIKYFKQNFNIKDDIHLYIEKHIPMAAGLGGGSSNFYYTIDFLNKHYNLKLSKNDLVNISNQYGSDIAFFSEDSACLCEGRGEILTPIGHIDNSNIETFTPNIQVSTKEIYEDYDNIENKNHDKQSKTIIDAIKNNEFDKVYDQCFNSLEDVTIKKYPVIQDIKNDYYRKGAKLAMMSGSGPTVFYIN